MLIWSVVSFLYTKRMFISIIRLPLWKQKKSFCELPFTFSVVGDGAFSKELSRGTFGAGAAACKEG